MAVRAKSKRRKAATRHRDAKVGWAEAGRDFLVNATNKGVLPTAGFIVVAAIMFWRMPPQEIANTVNDAIGHLVSGYLLGWALCVVAILVWIRHVKSIRRACHAELKTMADERNKWQERALEHKLESSDE